MSSLTTQEIIEFIIGLIDINKIEIKEENMNLKFILISTLPNHSNVELKLQKKNIISNEMIEKLLKELENIKQENKELKDCIGKLNERMKKIEDKEIEENNKNKIKVRFIYNSIQVIGLIIENNYEIIKKKINQICSITSNDKGIEYYFMTKDNERKEYLSENDHQLFLQQKYLIFNVKNPNKKTISFELDNSIYFYVLKTN